MFKENVKPLQRRQLAFSHTATPETYLVFFFLFFAEYSISFLVRARRVCETVGDTIIYIYWRNYYGLRHWRVALNQNCLFFSVLAFYSNYVYIAAQVPHHFHIYCKTRQRQQRRG